jgi:hypothetical protein
MYSELTLCEEIEQEQQLIIAPVQRPSVKTNLSPKLYEDCDKVCPTPGCGKPCSKIKNHSGNCTCGASGHGSS